MDFDAAWCPACDRQIQPKRYTVLVHPPTAAPPPPPPSSPRKKAAVNKKGGLVNGTGRVRPNGTIKQSPPAPPAPPPKTRTVIDQGPLPLYCSDECQLADLSARRAAAPIDPSREEPVSAAPIQPKKAAFTTAPSESGSDTSSESKPLSSIERLAQMYNFPPLPTPPPTYEEPAYDPPEEYNSGVMMAGRLISSLSAPPAKPQVGRYHPAPEPYKVVPGWTDGSNAWRSTVYSLSSPKSAQDPFNRDSTAKSYGSFTAASHRSRPVKQTLSAPSASSSAPSHSHSDDMLAKFGQNFARRSESRTSLFAGSAATPSSPSSTHSLPVRRERSIVPPGAEGKLLVPDVKLKVHSGSSASLSSAWSGPISSSSRKSVRSPLSATSDSDDDFDAFETFATRRPTIETRSWSYDNVKTYPIMQLPPKTVKKVEMQLIDGEERQVEVEVEVPQERKRLFLFAPTTRISQ